MVHSATTRALDSTLIEPGNIAVTPPAALGARHKKSDIVQRLSASSSGVPDPKHRLIGLSQSSTKRSTFRAK
jgi:sirohydrochlorin ferrochelatase